MLQLIRGVTGKPTTSVLISEVLMCDTIATSDRGQRASGLGRRSCVHRYVDRRPLPLDNLGLSQGRTAIL